MNEKNKQNAFRVIWVVVGIVASILSLLLLIFRGPYSAEVDFLKAVFASTHTVSVGGIQIGSFIMFRLIKEIKFDEEEKHFIVKIGTAIFTTYIVSAILILLF